MHALESQVKGPEGHEGGSTRKTASVSASSVSLDVLRCDEALEDQSVQDAGFQFFESHENRSLLHSSSSDPLQIVSNSTSQPDIDLPISTDDPFWGPFGFWPDGSIQFPSEEQSEEHPSLTNPVDGLDISAALQSSEASTFSFPDDRTLEVPSLTLLNAAMKVAHRLNLAHLIWDLTAVSPYYRPRESSKSATSPPSLGGSSSWTTLDSTSTAASPVDEFNLTLETESNTQLEADITTLPPHLQPTPTQRLIPHHPLLDLLPWPSTRDKLIQVFHLPLHLRPKNAQDPMALVRLVYDMEDGSGEGIKVQPGDPFEPGGWEIGQVVFERWWWAFEGDVVERSNRGRRGRGERVLVLSLG